MLLLAKSRWRIVLTSLAPCTKSRDVRRITLALLYPLRANRVKAILCIKNNEISYLNLIFLICMGNQYKDEIDATFLFQIELNLTWNNTFISFWKMIITENVCNANIKCGKYNICIWNSQHLWFITRYLWRCHGSILQHCRSSSLTVFINCAIVRLA